MSVGGLVFETLDECTNGKPHTSSTHHDGIVRIGKEIGDPFQS